MNAKELRDKTPDQLRDELVNLKKEAFNLRFQQATGQLENTARMRIVPSRRGPRQDHSERKGRAAAGRIRRPDRCPNVSCKAP